MNDERVEEQQIVQVQFNKTIIDRFRQSRISLDHIGTVYLVLVALFEEKYDLLDFLDDSNQERRIITLYRLLVQRDLLEHTPSQDDYNFRLTKKGIELVVFLKDQCRDMNVCAENILPIAEIEVDDIGTWIVEYTNIFPERNAEGRLLRQHYLTAIPKMRQFIKKHKYSKETILEAAKMYIRVQEENDRTHKFTKNSNNFIQKYGTGGESELGAWCQHFLESTLHPKDNNLDTSVLDMI